MNSPVQSPPSDYLDFLATLIPEAQPWARMQLALMLQDKDASIALWVQKADAIREQCEVLRLRIACLNGTSDE